MFSRFSYGSDDVDDFCQIFGVDCSPSATSVGIQIQGGIAKGKLHLEGRFGGTVGNPFIVLFGYKFGGV